WWSSVERSSSFRPSVGASGKTGGAHVDFGTEADPGGPPVAVEVEHDALALAQHPEDGAGQGVGGEVVLGPVRVPHHHTLRRAWVVGLDDSLQGTSISAPGRPTTNVVPRRYLNSPS